MITVPKRQPASILNKIPPRPARAPENWKGVPHSAFCVTLASAIKQAHLSVLSERWEVSADGHDLSIGYTFKTNRPTGQDWDWGIAAWTSNDTHRGGPRLYYGLRMHNPAVSLLFGECPLTRPYSTNDSQADMNSAVAWAVEHFNTLGARAEGLQLKHLTPPEVDLTLLAAGKGRVLQWGRLGLALEAYEAWDAQNHPGTAWALYGAVAGLIQAGTVHRWVRGRPGGQLRDTLAFGRLLPGVVD